MVDKIFPPLRFSEQCLTRCNAISLSFIQHLYIVGDYAARKRRQMIPDLIHWTGALEMQENFL